MNSTKPNPGFTPRGIRSLSLGASPGASTPVATSAPVRPQAPPAERGIVRRFSNRLELRGVVSRPNDVLAELQASDAKSADLESSVSVATDAVLPVAVAPQGPASRPRVGGIFAKAGDDLESDEFQIPDVTPEASSPEPYKPASTARSNVFRTPVADDSASAGAKSSLGAAPDTIAERSVIGAVLDDNEMFDTVAGELRAEDFADTGASAVFAAIQNILDGKVEGVTVADVVTVVAQPGVARYVNVGRLESWIQESRESIPDLDALTSRIHIVCEASRERKLHSAIGKAQDTLAEDHRSLDDRATEIGKLLSDGHESKKLEFTDIGDFAVEAMAKLVERSQSGSTVIGVPTPYRELNALLAGLQGGQLIVLAARPSVGKSALALGIGLHAAENGYPTMMASLEMGGGELSMRAIAIASGVDAARMRVGALEGPEWARAMDAAEWLKRIPFKLSDMAMVDIGSLQSKCRKLHREGKLKLLIVDYLQLMQGNPRLSREQQVSEISRGLKMIAKELDIPVLALSQLNRSVEARTDKRPMMSDLRESGAIEQDADVIIFIHREEVFNKNTLEKGVAEIIVAKQRSGSTGELRVRYLKATTKFEDFESVQTLMPEFECAPASIDPLGDFLPSMHGRN